MASYIASILGPDEHITYEGRTTNWIYVLPWIIAICTLGIGLPLLLFPYFRQKSTELAVTDRRVIAKFGLISRRTIEMRMSKIESIRIEQGFWERVGGFGTVIVHGTGGASEPIPEVRDPIAFKKAVEVQLEAFEDAARNSPGARLNS